MKTVAQRYRIEIGMYVVVFAGSSNRRGKTATWRICELFDDHAMCCCASIKHGLKVEDTVKVTFKRMNEYLSFEATRKALSPELDEFIDICSMNKHIVLEYEGGGVSTPIHFDPWTGQELEYYDVEVFH